MKPRSRSARATHRQPTYASALVIGTLVCGFAFVSCGLISSRYRPEGPEGREERLTAFLSDRFQTWLDLHPMAATRSSMRPGLDQWDEIGSLASERERELAATDSARLDAEFAPSSLRGVAARNRGHYARRLQPLLVGPDARKVLDLLDLGSDCTAAVPRTLLQYQRASNRAGLDAYLRRLAAAPAAIDDYRQALLDASLGGHKLSRTIIDGALRIGRWISADDPLEEEAGSPLLSDYRRRVHAVLAQDPQGAASLISRATGVIEDSLEPAYARLLTTLEQLQSDANDAGLWKSEGGAESYAALWSAGTGGNFQPEANHSSSARETEALHREVAELARKLGHVTSEATDEEALNTLRSERWITATPAAAGESTQPVNSSGAANASLTPIEKRTFARLQEIQEQGTAVEFLFLDWKTPTIQWVRATPLQQEWHSLLGLTAAPSSIEEAARLWIDIEGVAELPRWRLEALVAANASPGRLWYEVSRNRNEALPGYRRAQKNSALADGWTHYAVGLASGIFADNQDEHRLAALTWELWGSALATVDTGIHVAHWARERAHDYLRKMTPWTERELQRGLDAVMLEPCRAASARAALVTIRNLRLEAESILGEELSLPEFHAALLAEGGLPLDLLSESVREWILRSRN